MSGVLYRKELRTNFPLIFLFLMIITMYATIIISMYDPYMNSCLQVLAKSMPEIFAAFGMMNVSSSLIDFITNYLYGFLLIIFPFLLNVILCYRLMGKYIDHGSMAYLLSTPIGRRKIVMTQYLVLLTAMLIVVMYTFVLIVLLSFLMVSEESLDIIHFLYVNIGLLALQYFLGSLCYLSALIFNEARLSIGIGAGINILFIMIWMLSQVGDQLEILHYLTPLSLFDPQLLSTGDGQSWFYIFVLLLCSGIVIVLGQWIFQKRDLPL